MGLIHKIHNDSELAVTQSTTAFTPPNNKRRNLPNTRSWSFFSHCVSPSWRPPWTSCLVYTDFAKAFTTWRFSMRRLTCARQEVVNCFDDLFQTLTHTNTHPIVKHYKKNATIVQHTVWRRVRDADAFGYRSWSYNLHSLACIVKSNY